jgi:hypothetical protein
MRVVAGIAGAALIVLLLSEFFVTFVLPRRVKRDPRIARGGPGRRTGARAGRFQQSPMLRDHGLIGVACSERPSFDSELRHDVGEAR